MSSYTEDHGGPQDALLPPAARRAGAPGKVTRTARLAPPRTRPGDDDADVPRPSSATLPARASATDDPFGLHLIVGASDSGVADRDDGASVDGHADAAAAPASDHPEPTPANTSDASPAQATATTGAARALQRAPAAGGTDVAAYARANGLGIGSPTAIARQLALAAGVADPKGSQNFGDRLIAYILGRLSNQVVLEIAKVTYYRHPHPGAHRTIHRDVQGRFSTLPASYVRMVASAPHRPVELKMPALPHRHQAVPDAANYPLRDLITMLRGAHDGLRLRDGTPAQQRALRHKVTQLTTTLTARWDAAPPKEFDQAIAGAASDLLLLDKAAGLPRPRNDDRRRRLETSLAGTPDGQQPGVRIRLVDACFVGTRYAFVVDHEGRYAMAHLRGHGAPATVDVSSKYEIHDDRLILERADGSTFSEPARLSPDWGSFTWSEFPGERFERRAQTPEIRAAVARYNAR